MSVSILSSLSVWQDFVIDTNFNAQSVSNKIQNGLNISEFYIDGNKTEKGQAKFFVTSVYKNLEGNLPVLFMLKDFEQESIIEDMIFFANLGYIVCTVDIEGRFQSENYTIYPECMSYANYVTVKDTINQIDETVKESCWYEWGVAVKYAIKFFKEYYSAKKLGVIAKGRVATVAWEAVANNEDVASFVVLFNGGWQSYRGDYKSNYSKSEFSDSELAYIAGVEPQSYAQYVKCPTFIVENPNDRIFDADRAHDTLKRVDNEKKGIIFDPCYIQGVSQKSFNSILIFLNRTLLDNVKTFKINEPNISSRILNGEIVITIESIDNGAINVNLFASEEILNPSMRCYKRLDNCLQNGKKYIYKYKPYNLSGRAVFFATVEYECGIELSTNFEFVEFKEEEIKGLPKNPVLYSSRDGGSENMFISLKNEKLENISKTVNDLQVRNGAQGIKGISIKGGILTYSVYTKKYAPNKDNILMFDVYSQKETDLTVKCIFYDEGKVLEFSSQVHCLGLNVWQNQKKPVTKFKMDEVRPLKDYEMLVALEFYSEDDVLINNILWI